MDPGVDTATAEAWRGWRDAAREPAVDAGLRAVYEHIGAAVAARGPTCWVSGKCCKFESYGHRLYVTAVEVAWVLERLRDTPPPDTRPVLPLTQYRPADGCVYQIQGQCSVHAVRPLGCRVFFCEAGTEAWQSALYESSLAMLRDLHDAHGVPYRYLEWRAGLNEARAALDV
jgi:Fe-S-cluster containining protein